MTDSTLFHNSKQWTLVFNRNHYVISSYYDEGAKFVSIKFRLGIVLRMGRNLSSDRGNLRKSAVLPPRKEEDFTSPTAACHRSQPLDCTLLPTPRFAI